MHLFYADESYDQHKFVMTAMRVDVAQWRDVFTRVKSLRSDLRTEFGIKLKKELHAQSFVRHCSDSASTRKLSLAERRDAFASTLRFIATLPIEIINVALDIANYRDSNAAHLAVIDRLFNRIQTNVTRCTPQSHAIVIFDTGKERQITKLARQLAVFNYIPSQFDRWENGHRARNIVTDRIIEDPVFRDSRDSYFLQLVDFVAFVLLKKEVPPTEFITRWGYHELFPLLDAVLCKAAHPRDRYGIVRN